MKSLARYILLAASLVALAGCSLSRVTGTYLARFSNGLIRIQLVQVGDRAVIENVYQLLSRETGSTGKCRP